MRLETTSLAAHNANSVAVAGTLTRSRHALLYRYRSSSPTFQNSVDSLLSGALTQATGRRSNAHKPQIYSWVCGSLRKPCTQSRCGSPQGLQLPLPECPE